MGVYLSTPNTELESEDGESSKLLFGAASMQGWRVSQEDSHIAIVDYDNDTSLFAVFDGHGGQEVAKYCSQHFPNFIKSLNSYKDNRLKECLEEAFLKFDQTLTQKEVIEDLKILSGNPRNESESEDEINETILLREEADLPIADLIARYSNTGVPEPKANRECGSSSSSKSGLSLPSHMRNEMTNKSKPISPFLRAKRTIINDQMMANSVDTASAGVSSSAGQSSSVDDSNEMFGSGTHSSPEVNTNEKIESENKVPVVNSEVKESEEPKASNGNLVSEDKKEVIESETPIEGSAKEDNQTSDDKSDIKSESNSDTNEVTPESGSELPYKGKGKHKKIISPKKVVSSDDSITEEKPIYKYFLEDFDESDDSEDEEDFEGNNDSSDEDNEEDDEESEDESDDEEEEEVEEESVKANYYEKPGFDSGCTAVVALLKGNQLFVANAGDSRCVVSRNGMAIEMSVDHKPEDDIERTRVENAGGKVTPDGRVNGGLNLSRAIGDHAYKKNKKVSDREQMITSLPDIRTLDLEHSDEFMVIACDGIWNSLNSQQVVDFVGQRINSTEKLSSICDELFQSCLAPNTHGDGTGCDNMTAVIIKFVNVSPKRKLDNNGVDNETEMDVKTAVTTDEPEAKRVKANDCLNDETLVNEIDGKV